MRASANRTQDNESRAVANNVSCKREERQAVHIVDNSPHTKRIAQFQAMMDKSMNPHQVQLRKFREMIDNSPQRKKIVLPGVTQKKGPLDEDELQFKSKEAVQKKGPLDEEELQFKAKDTAQLAGPLDEDELQFKSKEAVQKKGPEDEDELQFKAKDAVQLKGPEDEDELQFKAEEPVQQQENRTGLPDELKAGVENLSGMAMDDVRVHYNSGKPAQLNAYAYTQGTEIHVAPGQEKHLPHEAWHVVQQKEGRVQPTMQMAGGVAVNDDKGLEKEADGMGGKAGEVGSYIGKAGRGTPLIQYEKGRHTERLIIQRLIVAVPGVPVRFRALSRIGGQNTPAIRRALQQLRDDRRINPAVRHNNNDYEAMLHPGLLATPAGLDSCHHVSDNEIQATVVEAANNWQAAPGNLIIWRQVQNLIAGINPAGAPGWLAVRAPDFIALSRTHYDQAGVYLGQLIGGGVLLAMHAVVLTRLANSIARSPMNLHWGLASTNRSLQQHRDPNNYLPAGAAPLTRRLTWRSEQMRAALAGRLPLPNYDYRTHAIATGMGGVAAFQAGVVPPPILPIGTNYVQSSGSGHFFTPLQLRIQVPSAIF